MVLWGTKYWTERESSETPGLYVSLGYSYWLLFVAVIFSMLDVTICAYVYHRYTLQRWNESH
ncbi:hypothetical protein ANCCAN_16341 [Ancylostoma caninum]|uniref:Uncharacterized protein n=1 Tax=Ancylostoma caninum TaxID=29170 RepID=A0A368G227_ANCCA|nr:hypothetical protein ANCCAN_16341 [Ancylostoma caninum]